MDDDKFALVEKIIKDIEHVMLKNAELCAFDIVPMEGNLQNKSPVLYLENCLGLESWCVKHVYMYCYSEIMDKYFCKPKRKATKITAVTSERLTKLLNVTLLLNPELTSLWNKRREMVMKCFLDKSSELQFTKLVLSRKPKCNDAFSYRRWLLQRMLQDEIFQPNWIENLVNEELHVSDLSSEKSPNNYHSWNHRMSIMNTLKPLQKQFDIAIFYVKEYESSERWASKHISDFSCFHYRQFCIKNMFNIDEECWKNYSNEANINKAFIKMLVSNFPKDLMVQVSEESLRSYSNDNLINLLLSYVYKNCNCSSNISLVYRKLQMLFYELALNNELLRFYKYHETLWYHRRFIVHELIAIMYDHFGLVRINGGLVKNSCKKCNVDEVRQKQAKIVRYDSNRVYSTVLFKILLSHEKKFVEERRNDSDNYADRHEKYLKFVEGLNNIM